MSSPVVQRAVDVLRGGGLVALPTETVYGLAADASNPLAVRRIFAVKGRPQAHPLIVHLGEAAQLGDWAREVPPLALKLASAFWPGPLTLVLPRTARALDEVTGGQDTVALRVPAHPLAREVLRAFGNGVAAPSANRFGKVSPTTAEHVRADLGSDIELILDGGPCEVGVESTIVDLSGPEPAVLRPGGVPLDALERAAGRPIRVRAGGPVRAPGMVETHYAPAAGVVLAPAKDVSARAAAWVAQGKRVAVLALAGQPVPPGAELLEIPSSTDALARELYGLLRQVDARGFDVAVVRLPGPEGLGLAVLDRLARAARR